MTAAAATPIQATMLFVVGNNEPVSVADVAYHTLMAEGTVRSRLATLERRDWITRTYTGHGRGSSFAYLLTTAGRAALDAADVPDDEDEPDGACTMCGLTDGRHMRACPHNPDRATSRDKNSARNSSRSVDAKSVRGS